MPATTPLFDPLSAEADHIVRQGNCLNVLREMEDARFDLILTSPPYNIGKAYEAKTRIEQYLETQEEIIAELVRTLSDRGSICWQVGNYVEKGEIFPLDMYYYPIFKKHGLKLRNRIIWHFGHGLHASKRFSGRYETLLWLTKTDEYLFNLDPVRIPSKYPGKRHFKGPKKGQFSGNPLGKNPSDLWEITAEDWDREIWDIPNVKSNHPEKTVHPCQFPVELVERCVLALTEKNSWVLDPFAGVGSTLVGALKHHRNALGIEQDETYCAIAEQRIAALRAGLLKTRPLTRPIHQPSRHDKVAQRPTEWQQLGLLDEKGETI